MKNTLRRQEHMTRGKRVLAPQSEAHVCRHKTQPRSQGSLLPALLSLSRSVGRVGENPGNEVAQNLAS